MLSTVVHLCQDGLPHHQRQESRPRQGLWGEKHLAHLVMALTKVKRRSGMMTRATFLLNKERKVCFSASYPRWVSSIWLRTLWTSRNISIQVCGKEPQGDGEAGGRRQGVGLHRGEEECERVSFSCSSSQEGGELPADWHPGEETLPFNLEDKKIFLGVGDNQLDMRRDATMGEPKVKYQLIILLLRWKPRFWT